MCVSVSVRDMSVFSLIQFLTICSSLLSAWGPPAAWSFPGRAERICGEESASSKKQLLIEGPVCQSVQSHRVSSLSTLAWAKKRTLCPGVLTCVAALDISGVCQKVLKFCI